MHTRALSKFAPGAMIILNKGDNAKAAGNLEKFIKLEPETERKAQAKAILEAIKK
jgi:hypothetical protein